MEDEWEELQSPWQIEAVPPDDHILIHQHRDTASVPPTDSPPSSSASSSPTPPPVSPPASASSSSESRVRSRAAAAKEMAATLRRLLWMVSAEVRRLASKAVIAGRFRKIAGAAAAFLLCLLYRRLRSRWRRRPAVVRDDSKDRLVVLLREKDQKISQLMVQIAEMNEALMARRRVPVIRVG